MTEQSPAAIAAARNVPGIARHVLLCIAADCDAERTAWSRLRRLVRERGLHRDVLLTEADCLGVCVGGPTALVYPDGTWYRGMDADRVADLVAQHLVAGREVTDLVTARAPLHPHAPPTDLPPRDATA